MSMNWLSVARHGGRVERCHTVTTIQSYNVGEHSFNAVLIAHSICEELDYKVLESSSNSVYTVDIDENRIARYLMLHDLAEGYTGDIPANVKKTGSVKKELDILEEQWEDLNVPMYMRVDPTSYEYSIAKLSDTLELCMFCIDDIRMGNRSLSMLSMADNACTYAIDYMDSSAFDKLTIVDDIVRELRGLL